MKKIIFPAVILALFMSSCYEDTGNYKYTDAEVITVEGIASSYSRVAALESITIDPTVTSTDPDAQFEYFWGIYEPGATGYSPHLDTIALTKAIDFLVTQEAKKWTLVFEAKNIHTGLSKIKEIDFNVTTEFTRGWYVLKDDGTNSDIDQYLTPDTIVPARIAADVFSSINGRKLSGKAKMLNFLTTYKSFAANPSVVTNTRTLVAVSDNDLSFVYINTMKQLRGFDEFSYEVPAVKSPEFVSYSRKNSSYYVNNNGKLHNIYAMTNNIGVFGLASAKNDANEPYSLSEYYVNGSNQNLYFDELSGSFITHIMAGLVLTAVADNPATEMSANKTNKTLLYLGMRVDNSSVPVLALMRDKTNPDLMILSKITGLHSKLMIDNDTITQADKLYQAGKVTTNQDENMIYFTVNNQVWSRNLSNGYEQLQYTAPVGEEISMIRHRKYSGEAAFAFNYIMIATVNASGNYKIHFFSKAAGNLNATPDFTMSGTGRVADVLYISPRISEMSYLQGK